MPVIVTIAQQKGGAGKTMLAANLAVAWARTQRVTLLDIDPQGSLARWHALRAGRAGLAPISFTAVSGWRVKGELDRQASAADILVIDTPPQIDSDAARAIRAAGLVVIPVQPSLPDLWASKGTLKLVAAERRRVAVVLNRAPARSALRSEVEAAFAQAGTTMLPQVLGDRRAYAQAFAHGMGVVEAAGRSLAGAELSALADVLLEMAR